MHPRRLASAAALVALAASLAGCGSQRFGNDAFAAARPPRGMAGASPALEPVAPALPSGPVTSAPLAPPPGATATPEAPPLGSGVAATPGTVLAEPTPTAPPVQQQASIAPPTPSVTTGGRSSVVGGWTAKDATGATCRVSLSSAPALDLYKASSSGCANKDLGRVTAWDYRDGEVYLYQPGGTVAARLRSGGGALDGVLSKSGAPLTLAR
jgi:hypothetical protein